MLEEHNKRDKAHLINLIGRRSGGTPNFALLIGAGASASSGIKTAGQMIFEWRRQIFEQCKVDIPIEEWLKSQDWYEDEEEYSILFEKVCDQRSQRRIYIEDCVKDAKPSWGYIYLANIIAHNYFNVVFTPNFDDLLNEACFIYADLRPMVCAHDSAVVDVRVTSARPKIIKLHGDFLYDNIKNTIDETQALEKNMREKFMQFAREYGLIVVGYGGNDRSITDILDMVLRSDGCFPHGVYWCLRDKVKVSKKLDRLMQRENMYWVELEGFDEFMAELHEGLGLTLPDSVRDPYKATTERLNRFISPRQEIKHLVIKDDIAGLEEQIKRFELVVRGDVPKEEFDRLVPYKFLGDREFDRNNYKEALTYFEKAMILDPGDLITMWSMSLSFIFLEQFDKALQLSEKMIDREPTGFQGYLMKGLSLGYQNRFMEAIAIQSDALKYTTERSQEALIHSIRSGFYLSVGSWEEALMDAEKALMIDPKDYSSLIRKCLAMKKLGNEEEAVKILRDALPDIKGKSDRACVFAVLGEKVNLLKELESAITEDSSILIDVKFNASFEDYRNDPDFRKLVYGDKN